MSRPYLSLYRFGKRCDMHFNIFLATARAKHYLSTASAAKHMWEAAMII